MTHDANPMPELPMAGKRRVRKSRAVGFLLLGVFFIVGIGLCGVRHFSAVHTPSALVEGDVLALGPKLPGRVSEMLVQKKQKVIAGQVLMRFAPSIRGGDVADAEAQAAAVRRSLPVAPDIQSVAERAANAQNAEQDIVNRIAQAQAVESEAARELQHKAEEHAKAQLELRRLDLLSAKYTISPAQYDKARNNEMSARRALENARAVREESSRIRAAVETELRRARLELAELRAVGARSRENGEARTMETPAEIGINSYALFAPEDSVVADIFTREGAQVLPNQQLITLIPEERPLGVTAWVSQKDSHLLRPGGSCQVFVLELPGQNFSGHVEQILPAGSIPARFPLSGLGQEQHVPVRIRFSEGNKQAAAELKPGMRAGVRMYRFDPPWALLKAHLNR